MALKLLDETALIRRLTNIPAGSSDRCIGVWAIYEPLITGSDYATIWAAQGGSAYEGIFGYIGNGISENTYTIDVDNGGGAAPPGATKIKLTGTLVHFAYRQSGSTHFFYVNGFLVGSKTEDMSAVVFLEQFLGNDGFSIVSPGVRLFDYFEYSSSKSIGTIQFQMRNIGVSIGGSNLVAFCPLATDLLDASGNGNHWLGSGNFTFVSNPAIPTNHSPQTAIDLAFGLTAATITTRVDVDGHTFDTFYKYTNNSGKDQVISIGHWGTPFPNAYEPDLSIYADIDLLVEVVDNFPNGSCTVPIPDGITYYFWFNVFNPGVQDDFVPSNLNIKTIRGPENPAQAGDVFIRAASFSGGSDIEDVLIGLHGGFIRSGSGIIGYIPQFPTGESGDIIPSTGRMVFADEGLSWESPPPPNPDFSYWIYVFDHNFQVLHKVAWESPQTPPTINRTHLPTNKVYLTGNMLGGDKTYSWIDGDGNLGPINTITNAALGGILRAIAVNNAETIMYIGVGATSILRRWNLNTLSFDSDLAASVAGYAITDILVLADDTIIVMYYKSSATRDFFIRRYTSAGTIVNTYTLSYAPGLGSTAPRLGYSATLDAFWVLHHITSDHNVSTKLKVDGTVLAGPVTTPNVLQSDNEQTDPPIPYTSDSCPIIELRLNQTNIGGTIIVTKITNPSTVSQIFNILAGGGLTPTSFQLSNGQSFTFENVPAGLYSIVEQLVEEFNTTYNVSDGNPNTAISLQDGETITVTITNTIIQKSLSGIYKIVPGKRQDTLWLENFTGTRDVKIP